VLDGYTGIAGWTEDRGCTFEFHGVYVFFKAFEKSESVPLLQLSSLTVLTKLRMVNLILVVFKHCKFDQGFEV